MNLGRQKADWLPAAGRWGDGVSCGGNESVQKLDCGDGCTGLRIYYKPLNGTLEIGQFYGM